MAWRRTSASFWSSQTCEQRATQSTRSLECPPDLNHTLAVNGLVADETTVRDGNCGIHAFITGLLQLVSRGGPLARTAAVRKVVALRRDPRKMWRHVRDVACHWLRWHATAEMWEGMPVHRLCTISSGADSFEDCTSLRTAHSPLKRKTFSVWL